MRTDERVRASNKNTEKDKKGDDGRQRNIEKELELAKQVLSRLGQKLPGNSPEEIEAYVRERKRKWPSRTNVERKLHEAARAKKEKAKPKKVDALTQLANIYADCDEGDEVGHRKAKKRSRGNRRGLNKQPLQRRSKERRNLLKELLRKDISNERYVLLQAIEHFVKGHEESPHKKCE